MVSKASGNGLWRWAREGGPLPLALGTARLGGVAVSPSDKARAPSRPPELLCPLPRVQPCGPAIQSPADVLISVIEDISLSLAPSVSASCSHGVCHSTSVSAFLCTNTYLD